MRIYIAGPMRGYPQDNFPAFDEAEQYLINKGWDVVSPAALDKLSGYDPSVRGMVPVDFSEAIARDVTAIRSCEYMALLPGWRESRGVSVELALAQALDLTIYEYDPNGTYGGSALKLTPLDYTIPPSGKVGTLDTGVTRAFSTGATRGTAVGKLDYEGFLSYRPLEYFAQYMDENREQPDGSVRDSDNWQNGFPIESFIKSGWRHWMDIWKGHRKGRPDLKACAAMMFNVMGYMDQILKEKEDTNV